MTARSLGVVELRCRRCPQVKVVRRAVLNRAGKPVARRGRVPSTRYPTLEWTADGATYLCRSCAGRDNANRARRVLLEGYGVKRRDGHDRQLEAMRTHLARYVDEAGGQQAVLERAHAGARRGHSDRARARSTMARIASGNSRGQFRLCPRCDRLIYLSPDVVSRDSPGLHGACWRAWKMRPYPRPPKGPGRPRQLKQQLGWLVRHFYFGQSWGEIAERDGFGRSTVRDDVRSLVEHLPSTWREVYRGRPPGPSLDELLPIGRIRQLASWSEPQLNFSPTSAAPGPIFRPPLS